MLVADVLLEAMEREGLLTVFGIPGSANLGLYEKIPDHKVNVILMRHEQGAAHAADAYGRVKRHTPGVAFATSGPGATNLVTGLANAYMDSAPMIAITGQVPTAVMGRDAFQETDVVGVTMPITKHSFLVRDPEQITWAVRAAKMISVTNRPGPVLIDIPRDFWKVDVDFYWPSDEELLKEWIPGYDPNPPKPSPDLIMKAAKMLVKAENPVILAGGGVWWSGATPELLKLAEVLMAPIVTTLMGKNAVPADHPLVLGNAGMHGRPEANYALYNADVVLAVGTRFSDRTVGNFEEFRKGKKIIHIDIDKSEIGKNIDPDVGIVGDAKEALKIMVNYIVDELNFRRNGEIPLIKKAKEFGEQAWEILLRERGRGLKPWKVLKIVREELPRDAIVTTGVGGHQMWAALHFPVYKPGTYLTSGGLGTMGYGFPAAIGAKAAAPDKPVLDIDGDGSFLMTSQNLATVKQYNLNVGVLVFDNGSLQLIRQWQDLFFGQRRVGENLAYLPDFVKLANSFGIEGVRPESYEEMRKAIRRVAQGEALVIDYIVDPDIMVLPMIAPGKVIAPENIILTPEQAAGIKV